MKAVQFRKESGKEVTIFNFYGVEKEDMVEEGVVRVNLPFNHKLDFSNVEEIMRVFSYDSSDLTLQAQLVLNSVEDKGEVHFYLDQNHDALLEALTEGDGIAFREEEKERFHLYIPETLTNNSFQDIPLENITVIEK